MEEIIGRKIKKRFAGIGIIEGIVKSYDSITGYYEINYEDGDSEELEFKEIMEILPGKIENFELKGNFLVNRPKKKKKRRHGHGDGEAICSEEGEGSGKFTSSNCFGNLGTLDLRNGKENVGSFTTGFDLNVDITMVEEENFLDGKVFQENNGGDDSREKVSHKRKHSFDINLGVEEEEEEIEEFQGNDEGGFKVVGGDKDEGLTRNDLSENVEETRVKVKVMVMDSSSGLSERVMENVCSEESQLNDCNGGLENVGGDDCLQNGCLRKDEESRVIEEIGLGKEVRGDGVVDSNANVGSEDVNGLSAEVRGDGVVDSNANVESEVVNGLSVEVRGDDAVDLNANVESEDVNGLSAEVRGDAAVDSNGNIQSEVVNGLSAEVRGDDAVDLNANVESEVVNGLSADVRGDGAVDLSENIQSENVNLGGDPREPASKDTGTDSSSRKCDVVIEMNHEDICLKPPDKEVRTRKKRGRPKKSTSTSQMNGHSQSEDRNVDDCCQEVVLKDASVCVQLRDTSTNVAVAEMIEEKSVTGLPDKGACIPKRRGRSKNAIPTTQIDPPIEVEDRDLGGDCRGIASDDTIAYSPVKADANDVVIPESHDDVTCLEPLQSKACNRQKRGRPPKKVKRTAQAVLDTKEIVGFDMNSTPIPEENTKASSSDVVIPENHEYKTCLEPLESEACNRQKRGRPSKKVKSSVQAVLAMETGGFDMNSTPNPEENMKAGSSDVVIAENHEDKIFSEPLEKEECNRKRGRPKKVKLTTQTVLSTMEVVGFDMNSAPSDEMNMKDGNVSVFNTDNCEDRVCSEPLDKEACSSLKRGQPKKMDSSSQLMSTTIEFGGFDMNSTPNPEVVICLETPEKEACTPKKRGRRAGGKNSTSQTLLRRSTRRSSSASQDHVLSTDESLASNSASLSHEISVVLDSNFVGIEEQIVIPPKIELPPSSQDLKVDEIPIIDLFSIYSFLRSFSTVLFLSPFSLEAFLEALKHSEPNSLIDSIHFSIMHTLKHHLEFLSNEGSQSATDCLRSLDWTLLDVVTWPIYMVEYLLLLGPTLKPGFELGRLKVFLDDYYKQSPSLKAEILRCLCDDVIEAECVRSELNRRTQTSDLDMDVDRILNVETKRKKKDQMDDGGGSCLTQDVGDGSADRNNDECCLCKMEGNLICCDGCPAAYHTRCVGIPKDMLPEGEWFCHECVVSRYNLWMKSPKSLRGAELLGTDPHGRLYFGTCGYLLVLDSCEPDSSYHFYNSSDVNIVIEVLKASSVLYSDVANAIIKNWGIFGGNDYQNSQMHMTCNVLDLNNQISNKMWSSVAMPLSEISEGKNAVISYETFIRNEDFDLQGYMGSESEINLDSGLANQTIETNKLARRSEDFDEIEKVAAAVQECVEPNEDCLNGLSKTSSKSQILEESHSTVAAYSVQSRVSGVRLEKETEAALSSHPSAGTNQEIKSLPRVYSEPDHYVNYYTLGQNAASVVRKLLSKPPNNVKEDDTRPLEEIISPETRSIFQKSIGFSWSNIQGINQNARQEDCGWCLCCQNPSEGETCLFIPTNKKPSFDVSTSGPVSLRSKSSMQSHLSAVICHILSIEERLCGLLSGPWKNASYSKNWRKNVQKASDVASVKYHILSLELNMRRLVLLPEWLKHVDSVVTMGSASHIIKAAVQVPSSKNASARKRAKNAVVEAISTPTPASKLRALWWRGGRLSRSLFNFKVLPHSLVSKGARQGGCKKIPGISYSDSSEYPKRSTCIAWRASVEMSMNVAHLAYLVRELDSNIRWNDLENTKTFSHLSKESKKAMKLFKKVTIRRKSTEGTNIKYLLDFGKRRGIPDIVIKNGVMLEISASERKKYWLEESHIPLHILKAYEEKKQLLASCKMKPVPFKELAKYLNKSTRKNGLQLLLSRGIRSEYYKCGHCNKDVLIRDAVNCKDCEGFFHKRHVRKFGYFSAIEPTYQCHQCRDTSPVKKSTKDKPRTPMKKSVKAILGGRKVQLRKSKRVSTFVLRKPLPRKVKYMPVQVKEIAERLGKKVVAAKSKMVAGAKRTKQVKYRNQQQTKSKKEIRWYKGKRSQFYYAYYWLNGLHLTRNSDDERAMQFRESKLRIPSKQPSANSIEPKCNLCCETDYRSTAIYIQCGNCEEWFHGEACGVTGENENMILGFRCHKCRRRKPPICPYLLDAPAPTNEVEMLEEDNHSGSESPTDESKSEDQDTDSIMEMKIKTYYSRRRRQMKS